MDARRIALLTAGYLLEEPCREPVERRESAAQLDALRPACARAGLELVPVAWDDPRLLREDFDAHVIGPAWDYAERPGAFLATLETLAKRAPLHNPLELVRWNLTKTYLRDLAERGVRTVPTLWWPELRPERLDSAFEQLATDTLVAKPVVGQNAWRQALLERGSPLPAADALPPGDLMLQPFLPSIRTEGEVSLVFLGGELSHALRKLPARGDYRIQATHGGTERVHTPAPDELSAARATLEALETTPLIARVDQVRDPQGKPALMELELIEPYLYPEQGPELGTLFARALAARLGT